MPAGAKKKRPTTPKPRQRRRRPPVDPTDVKLVRGKGSKGRGGDRGGSYWHIHLDDKRVGNVYINVIDEAPLGEHASIQIQVNVTDQGRGIGSIAYGLAVRDSGHDTVYAHMRKSNTGSRKAAEHAGFEVWDDPAITQLVMVWRLSE